MEERFIEIETKVAFQENTVECLSQVVAEQQKQIDRLEKKVQVIVDQLRKSGTLEATDPTRDQPPPHY